MGTSQIYSSGTANARQFLNAVLETKWLYLFLNLFTISIPLIRSFEPRIAYYKSFGSLAKAILIWSGFFLVWDIWYTDLKVWRFNSDYLSGVALFGLPLGEYLFFITVPFACVFIYKCMELFFPNGIISPRVANRISPILILFCLVVGFSNLEKLYTSVTFLILGVGLIYVTWIARSSWLPRFYESYIVALLPFFLKNGILTGSFTEKEVVWYNDDENLGIRLGTIPFEDIFYGMLLILGIVYFYEMFESRRKSNADK